jgi:hypothetical protein
VLASGERRKVPVHTHVDLLPVLALPLDFPNTQNEKTQDKHRGVQVSSWCVVSPHAIGHATRVMRGMSTERQLSSDARAYTQKGQKK